MQQKWQNRAFLFPDGYHISGVVSLKKDTLFERHHLKIDGGDAKEHFDTKKPMFTRGGCQI